MNRFTEHIANTTAATKTRGHTSQAGTETDAIAKKTRATKK